MIDEYGHRLEPTSAILVGVSLGLFKSPLSARVLSKCLPGRALRRGKAATQPCARRSLRLKVLASKRFGFPLFSPSIKADQFDLCTALSLSPNEITDVFAIVGVVATFDLCIDPVIFVAHQCNGLADSRYDESLRYAPIA
jgi:hypothetical protein